MIMENLPALQIIIPLLAAPLCIIFYRPRYASIIALCASFLAFLIALILAGKVLDSGSIRYFMGGWKPPYGIEYNVDYLSAFMLVLVSGIGFASVIYSTSNLNYEIEEGRQPLFYAIFLLCLAGLLGILITNDIFNIYVFLEISSLATYALIAMGSDRRALFSSFEYLILGTIGATFFLLGVGFIYTMTGSLNIHDIAIRIPQISHTLPVKTAIAFLSIGLALKIAIFPMHLWLTNAYTNSPSIVSSFLSATATKVSVYVLVRILYCLFGAEFSFEAVPVNEIFSIFAIFAIIIGALVAIFQDNLRRMLAYSSVSQIGYIILGVTMENKTAIAAAMIHIFGHALAKSALFMAAGSMFIRTGSLRIKDLAGIGKRMPFTSAAFVIAGLSLIGIPATIGFVSKWYLLSAAMEQRHWLFFAVIIISSVLAIIYLWRFVEVAYFDFEPEKHSSLKEAPFAMLVPMFILAGLAVLFGIYASPVVNFANIIANYLFNFEV